MSSMPKNEAKSTKPVTKISDRTFDAWENSEAAAALKRLKANPRIRYIVLTAPSEACPACQQLVGTYAKDDVPALPYEECSHPLGCRAFYMPFIEELYP
jgi:hypothetical protein